MFCLVQWRIFYFFSDGAYRKNMTFSHQKNYYGESFAMTWGRIYLLRRFGGLESAKFTQNKEQFQSAVWRNFMRLVWCEGWGVWPQQFVFRNMVDNNKLYLFYDRTCKKQACSACSACYLKLLCPCSSIIIHLFLPQKKSEKIVFNFLESIW